MRDILVTADNADRCEMFRSAHIERGSSLRKRDRKPRSGIWLPLTDAAALTKQAAERARGSRDERFMTQPSARPTDPEPAFIEVGQGASSRRIAVRAGGGGGPGLFWLGGFHSDMKGTK